MKSWNRYGMQQQRKSSFPWDLVSVFYSLYHRTINFIIIAIGTLYCIDCDTLISVFRDALVTSTINCLTSVLAGFVVFSTLGHMANVSNRSVEEVIDNKGMMKRSE